MADANIIAPVSQSTATSGVSPQSPPPSEPGATVSGTIIGKDTNGNFLLRTPNGNLSLQSNLPLTYNSDIVIKFGQSETPGSNAKIISVNGEPFAEFLHTQQPEGDSISGNLLAQTSQSTKVPPENTQSQPQNIIRAVVVPTPTGNVVQPQTQQTNTGNVLANGANVIIRLPDVQETQTASPLEQANLPLPVKTVTETVQQISVETPAPKTTVAAQQEVVPVHAPNLQPTTANVSMQPYDSAARQQSANEPAQPAISSNPLYAAYSKQIAASIPQSEQPQATNQSAPGKTIQGQIITSGKGGTVTIQTQSGVVTLQADTVSSEQAAKLVTGTNVIIEPADNFAQTVLQAAIPQTPATFPEIAASWNSFKEIINLLNSNNEPVVNNTHAEPQKGNSLLSRLPVLGENFVSASLSFIKTLASGNANKILGDDSISNIRQNGRADLIQKFFGELANLTGIFSAKPEQQQTGWAASLVPFVFQGEVQQARIYVKRDAQNRKQSPDGQSANGTRFVVEVDLSEFGGVQMDGLVRRKQANTIFDLMIRSRNDFSSEEKSEITSIYNNAAAQTGFNGSIAFQVTNDFPIKPMDDILANKSSVITA